MVLLVTLKGRVPQCMDASSRQGFARTSIFPGLRSGGLVRLAWGCPGPSLNRYVCCPMPYQVVAPSIAKDGPAVDEEGALALHRLLLLGCKLSTKYLTSRSAILQTDGLLIFIYLFSEFFRNGGGKDGKMHSRIVTIL